MGRSAPGRVRARHNQQLKAEFEIHIVIVDTLLEGHVADSLERALRSRGHRVHATGKVWQGWELPASTKDRQKIDRLVDGIIKMRPDAVFVVRSAALRPEQVDRLREHGTRTVVWFGDDPLLYAVQSATVAPHYDICLHTATGPTLQMYETELGVRGLAFPFWTDDVAFPRRYDPQLCDLDIVFIGNTHNAHKQWRYDWVAGLSLSTAIYGRVADDPAGIYGGIAKDDTALGIAAARGRLGLNISQRFSDHRGTMFDFPQLAGFGEFSLPSRIVQLAAIGVPPVSFVGGELAAADTEHLFPPTQVVRSADELVSMAKELRGDHRALREKSDEAHEWYGRHYTAESRARFLEALVNNPARWTSLTTEERAEAFFEFPVRRTRTRKLLNTVRRTLRPARAR